MTQYIIRRLILMIPTLLGVSLLITALTRLLPGDAVDILLNEGASSQGPASLKAVVDERLVEVGVDPLKASFDERSAAEKEVIKPKLDELGFDVNTTDTAQIQQAKNEMGLELYKDSIRAELGIDKNYIEQWWDWTSHAIRGDLGESLVGDRSIGGELKRRIPASFQLGFMAMVVSAVVALPIGVISAVKQDSWVDYITRSFAISMLALPSFFIATLVIAFAARLWDYSFPIFYTDFWKDPASNLELVTVPAVILGFGLSGTLMRLTRAQMLEVMRQDYMRTARSKGLKQRVVVMRHGVRNAFIPVVTIMGLQIPVLIGGSLVLEQIFGIPGVAQYLFTAIGLRDFPTMIGVNMVVALTIMSSNLLVDLTYAYLDPRIRLS